MTRKSPGNDEYRVDADVIAMTHVARREPLCGDRHAPEPVMVQSQRSGTVIRASLDLDERKHRAATCNDVDFPSGDACPSCEYSPTLEAQVPAREALRPAAAFFG